MHTRVELTVLQSARDVMLAVCLRRFRRRLSNTPVEELLVVASEHAKITEGRLNKMLGLETSAQSATAAHVASSPTSIAAVRVRQA